MVIDGTTDSSQERIKGLFENIDAKSFRVIAQQIRAPVHLFEALDRFHQVTTILPIEEDSGNILNDCFHCSSRSIGDGRSTGCSQLQRSHAEILLAWKDQRTATRCIVLHFGVREAPEKRDRRPGLFAKPGAVRPIADDYQSPLKQIASLNRQIDPLIRDQTGQHQIIVFLLGTGLEAIEVYRRMNHLGHASIRALNPLSNRF